MDGHISRETVNPFRNPRQWLGALGDEVVATIVAAAADLALVVDRTGVVADVATSGELRAFDPAERWIGLPLVACVTVESVPKIEALLAEGHARGLSGWRQVNHPNPGQDDLPVLYSSVALGHEGRLLLLGRNLQPMALLQQRLLQAQQAMEQDYARLRQAETRYRLLFQLSGEGVVICDAATLRISEANPAATELLGPVARRLVGRSLVEGFSASSAAEAEAMLAVVRAAGRADPVVVTMASGAATFTLQASLFRQDNTTQLLVRMQPLAGPVRDGETESQRAALLLEQMPDGFVVTDGQGLVRSANLAFLDMVEVASEEQVRGDDLGRWLGRAGIDFPVLLNTLREHGSVRQFSSLVRGEYGATTDVEVAAATTPDRTNPWIGFAIRNLQGRPPSPHDGRGDLPRSLEQLGDLVGRVPLKELVRETTDIIEKMCIESALRLTGDNRASAAEMLGLSRQSLYVKMHRFGLGDLPGSQGTESPP